MIYEYAEAEHTYTIELIILMIKARLCYKQKRWRLIIFDRDERIVYTTLCDGIAQAEGYVHQYTDGYLETGGE